MYLFILDERMYILLSLIKLLKSVPPPEKLNLAGILTLTDLVFGFLLVFENLQN